MKKLYIVATTVLLLFSIMGCSNFLELPNDRVFTDEAMFGDEVIVKAVLVDLYSTVFLEGQRVGDHDQYMYLDEAGLSSGAPQTGQPFNDDRWRANASNAYTYIRRMNQFIQSVRTAESITETDRLNMEGEVRFLRAYLYFQMARGLGGMPIIGDEVFEYSTGIDITQYQFPRSTEAEIYDYVISECKAVYEIISDATNVNNARANKWVAKMLEARAAIHAASIANYNNKMPVPITTEGGEVGIPASRAQGYYETALAAAEIVINNSPYRLQSVTGDRTHYNLARNFYEATTVKDGNTEVIWARDYIYPGSSHQYTTNNAPRSHAEDIDAFRLGILLNVVEEFELLDTPNPGTRSKIRTIDESGEYIFYNNSREPFEARDPRLRGTVIYPGNVYKGREVVYQAGQINKNSAGSWVRNINIGNGVDTYDDNGILITSQNGPVVTNEIFMNKFGLTPLKFLDETSQSGTRGRGSEMWEVRFRMAEAYLIAAEAAMELNNNAKAAEYLNVVRYRAGVQPIEVVTLDHIIHERRVEFVFENHRYWDMKRWRLAHQVWNGQMASDDARHRRLFPYLVVAPGDPNHMKWVFEEDYSHMLTVALNFQLRHYYYVINQSWIDNNPKLIKNPFH